MESKEIGVEEINQLLTILRSYDSSIGNYEQHQLLPGDSTYAIKLTNGSLRIYSEELQDKQSLLKHRLKDIVARFREKR